MQMKEEADYQPPTEKMRSVHDLTHSHATTRQDQDPYEVLFKRRDSPYEVHFKHRDSPYECILNVGTVPTFNLSLKG